MYLQLHQRPQIRSSQHGCPMTLQKQDKITKIRDMGVLETFQHTHIRIEMPNPGQGPSTSFNAPKYELKGCTWSLDLQNQDRTKKILEPSGVEVQLNIRIKIKIPKSQSESYSIPKKSQIKT